MNSQQERSEDREMSRQREVEREIEREREREKQLPSDKQKLPLKLSLVVLCKRKWYPDFFSHDTFSAGTKRLFQEMEPTRICN